MIRLRRLQVPETLERWLSDRGAQLRQIIERGEEPPQALLDSYRHPDVKAHLTREVFGKCAYCESKISHVYYGDVEHIKPKSLFRIEQLDIRNLTFVCARCNGSKGDFWNEVTPLLNPFQDDPAAELLAIGFMVGRRPGRSVRGRLTIQQLDLNRAALLERRREHIESLQALADQFMGEPEGPVKALLRAELESHGAASGEYAMIVRAYLTAACNLTVGDG